MTELLLYLYAESPVHAGGASSLGALDLPVQREASTRYPVIWGQSLKGALRQAAAEADWTPTMLTEVFGSPIGEPSAIEDDGNGAQTTAGLLAVGDAQLAAMPVPTLRRTFAWVTSELALARLARKYSVLARATPDVPQASIDRAAVSSQHWIEGNATHQEVLGPCLVEIGAEVGTQLAAWAARLAEDVLGAPPRHGESDVEIDFGQLAGKLRDDLLLVDSTVMPMLVSECTEFVARVQLTADKTVENGPFYSEYLPAETILASSLSLRHAASDLDRERQRAHVAKLAALLDGKMIQVGGDETIGKGLVWARLLGVSS